MEEFDKSLFIRTLIKKKRLTQRVVAEKLGIAPQQFSNKLTGIRPLDSDFILKLKPILGDEVLELLDTSPPKKQTVSDLETVETRPRLPLNVAAGQNEILDGAMLAQCEQVPVVPMFPSYTFTMRVTGESMQPYINPGDEVACLKIEEPTFLQWGRTHVLFTTQGVVVKNIFDAGDGIRCVSINKNYPDFVIPKNEIYSYNLVVGLLRL